MSEKVVIVCPIWDTEGAHRFDSDQSRYTIEFVEQMKANPYDNFLCVLVDNGSDSDITRDYLYITLDDPRFHVITNKENMGYGYAANQGAAYGIEQGAEYIIIINNDVEIVDPYWVEDSFLFYLRENKNWLMGARYIPDNGWCLFDGKIIDYLEGYLLACHVDLWKKLAGFDENYFAYMEDVDLSYRAKLAGYELKQSPEFVWQAAGGMLSAQPFSVTVNHVGGRTGYNRADFDFNRITKESVLYFQKKHGFVTNNIPA